MKSQAGSAKPAPKPAKKSHPSVAAASRRTGATRVRHLVRGSETLSSKADGLGMGLLVLAAFLVPLAFWPTSTEYGQAKLALALTAIGMLWTLLLWPRRLRDKRPLRVPVVALGGAGLILAAGLSGIHAASVAGWFESFLPLAGFIGLVVAVATISRDRRGVHAVLWGVLAAAAAAALYGLLQAMGLLAGGGTTWMPSFMGNPNYLGGFLAVVLPASCALAVFSNKAWQRAVALVLLAVCWTAFPLLNHFGGLAAVSVSFLAATIVLLFSGAWRALLRRKRWSLATIAVVAGGLICSFAIGPGRALFRAGDEGAFTAVWEDNSGPARETIWKVGGRMLAERPVFGAGLGDFAVEYIPELAELVEDRPETNIPGVAMDKAHSDYVQAAAEMGGAGIAAVVAALGLLLVYAVRRIRGAREDHEKMVELILLVAGAISFLALAAVSFPAHLVSSSWAAVFALGLSGSAAYGQRSVIVPRSIFQSRAISWGMFGAAVVGLVLVSMYAWAGFRGDVLLGRGITQLQLGQSEQAEMLLSRSIAADPMPREAYFHRAMATIQIAGVRAAAGKPRESADLYVQARDDLERCQAVFRRTEVYLAQANLGFVLDDLQLVRDSLAIPLALPLPVDTYVQALYLSAILAGREGNVVEAEGLLQQAVNVDPTYVRARIALAELYTQLLLPARAEEQYRLTIEIARGWLGEVEDVLATEETVSVERFAELTAQAQQAQTAIDLAEQGLAQLADR
ncbi:O-antigen ligase family protein [Candidatus Bipolaricaulota bacterium]|nr:O-antigen ligase family protein [Candidatus Bipolaricaulota bacterium]